MFAGVGIAVCYNGCTDARLFQHRKSGWNRSGVDEHMQPPRIRDLLFCRTFLRIKINSSSSSAAHRCMVAVKWTQGRGHKAVRLARVEENPSALGCISEHAHCRELQISHTRPARTQVRSSNSSVLCRRSSCAGNGNRHRASFLLLHIRCCNISLMLQCKYSLDARICVFLLPYLPPAYLMIDDPRSDSRQPRAPKKGFDSTKVGAIEGRQVRIPEWK
jgi:hypothetical protein